MSIVDAAVGKILAMVPQETLIGDEGGFQQVRLSDAYLSEIERMEPTPEVVLSEGEDFLGTYRSMASPGCITLYWERIGAFFWHNVAGLCRAGLLIEPRELKRLATVAVYKTYAHERFHYFCDVSRHLLGGSEDRMMEEALAVASSFHALETARKQWNSPAGLLGNAPYRMFMDRIFAFRAPGYRDWVRFQSRLAFEEGVAQYLVSPAKWQFLTSSGVDPAPIIQSMKSALMTGGAIEKLSP